MTTGVRIRAMNLDILLELQDPANGKKLLQEVVPPNVTRRQSRVKSARVGGSFAVGASVPDDGTLSMFLRFEGATWAQVATRAGAALDVIEALDEFYVDVDLTGVLTRWYSDAPVDILPEPIDRTARLLLRRDYELRFLVQPNPTVTIV